MMRLLLWLAAALAAFAVLTTVHYHLEDLDAFEAEREAADVTLLQSGLGKTRYALHGADGRPVVVLIHSFNGFAETWQPNIDALVERGFQVLTYDLWGRGYSDRPPHPLTLGLFIKQLEDLLSERGAGRVHLVGASFGSVIATEFAVRNPQRVAGLVLLGPAGWPKEGFDRTAILDLPLLGDALFHYLGVTLSRGAVEDYFVDPGAHAAMLAQWEYYARLPGFTRSALSTLRHAPVRDYTAGWPALGRTGIPTLVIWGKQDISFPYSNAQRMQSMVPQAQVIGIDGAHWVNVEQAALVNETMGAFLLD